MVGAHVQLDLTVMDASVSFDVTAKAGAHLELEVKKTRASETSFALDVQAGPERDITVADATGARSRQPGKVDAYRFISFYLAPQTGFHDLFFTQVVDPIWLKQSGDRNAAALRQAYQPAKRPACWRVFHRVTYVSRVLPPLAQGPAAPAGLDRALLTLDIDSNYELIKALEPYVQGHTSGYGDLSGAVRQAVTSRLPDLIPHIPEIVSFLALYYGVPNVPALDGLPG